MKSERLLNDLRASDFWELSLHIQGDLTFRFSDPAANGLFIMMSAPVPLGEDPERWDNATVNESFDQLLSHLFGKIGQKLIDFSFGPEHIDLVFEGLPAIQFDFPSMPYREWNWALTRNQPFSWTNGNDGLVAADGAVNFSE